MECTYSNKIIENLRQFKNGKLCAEFTEIRKKYFDKKNKECLELGIKYNHNEIEILKKLEETRQDIDPKILLTYVNLIILFRQNSNKEYYNLKKYSIVLKNMILDSIENKTIKKDNSLCSLEQLKNYTNDLYDLRNYKGYIINILLLSYYVRNKDLNLIITSKQPETKHKNYLYLYRTNSIIYYRNDYITVEKYGRKTHKIKDEKFYNACLKLLKEEEEVPLLKASEVYDKNGLIHIGNIGDEILRATYNRLGESKYFKIIVDNASENELREICEIRGVNVDSIYKN